MATPAIADGVPLHPRHETRHRDCRAENGGNCRGPGGGTPMSQETRAGLLALLDEAYDRRSWHGTNLRGAVRTIEPHQATWRPGPGRHNVWELVVHAAYWKYVVRSGRAVRRAAAFRSPAATSFRARAMFNPQRWQADLSCCRPAPSLRAMVAALEDGDLCARWGGKPLA